MQYVARVVMVMMSLQLSLAGHLWAFAVGDMTVHSRRGELFAADIRLLLEAREREQEIEVRLGHQDAYRSEGFKRPAVIDTLKAGLASSTRDVIHLSSTVPLQEAAFDLVLLVRAGQVTIVKHYAVALSAPAPTAGLIAAPLPTIAPVAPAASAPKVATRSPRHLRRPERYGPVGRGETLYSVAKSLRVPNDKLWQAVVVLWQANKGQFQGGNLHGLPVGTFLAVPTDLIESMVAIPLSEAQEIITGQWEEWRTLQRSGLGKQRVMVAAHDSDAPASEAIPQAPATAVAAQREAMAPIEKMAGKPTPEQAVVLPMGQAGNMISMAELQTVLQGLEERLMRRLTPISQTEMQEARLPTALVSTSELQASIQSLEERLTQRMQHMLWQTPEPVQVGQRLLPHTLASAPVPPAVVAAQPVSPLLVPYILVFTNALLLLLAGALIWLWWRRRDRVERMQGV